jgi:hypothetical protein
MTRPLIQIDDETREMTDEEFTEYQKLTQDAKVIEGYIPIELG